MNPGLLGLPHPTPHQPGFRFIPVEGLRAYIGDTPRFGVEHLSPVAVGLAIPQQWSPVAGDHEAVVSIDRECLLVGTDGAMGAIWMRCAVEVDVVLEILPELPGDDPGIMFMAGGFIAVGAEGYGAMLYKHETSTVDLTWEGGARTLMIPMQTAFAIDPTDAALPVTPRAVPTSTDLLAPRSSPLLVRLKRKNTGVATSVMQAFISPDGYSWQRLVNETGVDVTTPADVGVLVYGTATTPFTARVRLAGVKFLDPTTDPV